MIASATPKTAGGKVAPTIDNQAGLMWERLAGAIGGSPIAAIGVNGGQRSVKLPPTGWVSVFVWQ